MEPQEPATRRVMTFQEAALASGLCTEAQLAEAGVLARGLHGGQLHGESLDKALADACVRLEFINEWQMRQLVEGRVRFFLGTYQVIGPLGQGGMGQVFKAISRETNAVVAIKVLPISKTTPQTIENFSREIKSQAKLNHPNLVRVVDSGYDGNVYFMVNEYVPGANLRKLVRRNGPLSMESAAGIARQTAAGLAHAHRQGIIHRDVKPGNILVTPEGIAKLSDLGLASPMKTAEEEDPRFGRVVGTADYLSPDHIKNPREPSPAWDIYSLGCTLYYAVTAKVPFPGGSTTDKVRSHCELYPLDPRRLNPELSAEFVELIAQMMAKDPENRIQSAEELEERLSRWSKEPAPIKAADIPRRPASDSAAGNQPGGKKGAMADTVSNFPDVDYWSDLDGLGASLPPFGLPEPVDQDKRGFAAWPLMKPLLIVGAISFALTVIAGVLLVILAA